MSYDQQELHSRLEKILKGFSIGSEVISPINEWLASGVDVDEIGEWLQAGCFSAGAAGRMENAGITPDQAALVTNAGDGIEDTIGFKVAKGILGLNEARRIITQTFWNS